MKLLLHTCCAPCLIGVLPSFTDSADTANTADFEITCFWFNPNIHPYTEYQSRLNAFTAFTQSNNINSHVANYYGLRTFLRVGADNIAELENPEKRCEFCYDWRMKECALLASENNFDAFSSTLSVSPYQNHAKIREAGEKYAGLYGVGFFYCDFRENFRAAQKRARENGIYMQKYCGCIFSEEERYLRY